MKEWATWTDERKDGGKEGTKKERNETARIKKQENRRKIK